MRIWLIVLALTSAALAGTTAWLALELSEERARHETAPALASTVAPVPIAVNTQVTLPQSSSSAQPLPITPVSGSSQGVVLAAGEDMSPEEMKKMQQQFARQLLEQLTSPEGREDAIAQHRVMYRHMYARIDKVLGLTPEEHTRFLELLARQQVEMQERGARCALEPDCDQRALWNTRTNPKDDEVNELLGAQRAEKFSAYKNSMGEREAVSQLRTRLSDSQRLSEETAESLIVALADERETIARERPPNGEWNSFGFGGGMIMTSGDTFEERYESARRNSQRLRERAAQYLSTEQMRAFNELQDDTLTGMRAMLRNNNGPMSFSAVAVDSGD